MIVLIGKYIETAKFEKIDPETGIKRVDKSYRVHVPHPDGTILPETIYFPRDPTGKYREPNLQSGEVYSFPVSLRPTRDGKRVSFTALLDKLPFAAPRQASDAS